MGKPLKILLIAFEMPPARSAGVQRPYRFAEYLAEMGAEPYVLTASADIYQRFDHELQISPLLQDRIFRSKATDASKLFSLFGRSPAFAAVPDRYWPWYFSAVALGQQLIREHDIDLIWSTYPVLTSHLIGRSLSKKTGKPWVADFRDPLQCHYNPAYQHFNGLMRYLERKVVAQASAVVTTSQAAADLYRNLYPAKPPAKFQVIENGFVPLDLPPATTPDKFTLLYSGALYGNGRDISGIFRAIAELQQQGLISADNFVLKFRGSGKPEQFAATLTQFGISALVEFLPAVPFMQAQAEMMQCSANLLIQDQIFQYQIPGKLYDYIQSGKPLLAICPPGSATAEASRVMPNAVQAWQQAELTTALQRLITAPPQPGLSPAQAQPFSRRQRTVELMALCQQLLTQQL
ncbi:glycosyltransferase [Rheinheimera texasensis]|uniref:glycosyltransferase n=1 Tax=Rheinheimera texasensis TaxID=306205 RepID=UPI0004E0D138|nr:glycosyltransferase [Rheinheimera texasensis]